MTTCSGLLLAVALAAGGLDVEAGLGAGARSRSARAGAAAWRHTLELVATPRLALVAERPDWRLSAGYQPSLTAPDVLDGAPVDAWQELRLAALLRASPTLQLEAGAVGAMGTSSLLADDWGATGPAPVRTSDRIDHFNVRAELAAAARLRPDATLSAALGWSRGGGSDAASRVFLPIEEALRLEAWLTWRVTRADELELRLSGSDTRLDLGSRATISLLSLRWRRRLDAALAAWAAAGGGVVRVEGTPASERPRGQAAGEVGLEHALPAAALTQRLAVHAVPVVDRLQGTVDARVDGEYAAAVGQLPGWRLTGRGLAAMTRRAPGTDHLALLELRLERGLGRDLTLRAGVQGSRQRSTDPALPTLVEWIGLLGVDWAALAPRRR